MKLTAFQNRLEEHFSALRADRSTGPGDRPVFALEHGLSEQDIDTLKAAVCSELSVGALRWEHRLPWTVYAAELGYLYSGFEYWQTFASMTPGWPTDDRRSKDWIRQCFSDFAKTYGGATPTGSWAMHFSRICWPITHAILPRDLQQQLARILYVLRHDITSRVLDSPRRMGELIASQCVGTSSRFQLLVQEPAFIGQIATALLSQRDRATSDLILQPTLLRIGRDLDRERVARTWMQDVRRQIQRQVRFQHPVGVGGRASARSGNAGDDDRPETSLGLEPRVVLRPVEGGQWDVVIELPDLSHVPSHFPSLRDLLNDARCRVGGSSQRWRARGWLMRGPQKIRLQQWPSCAEPVLQFEQSTEELDWLLQNECLLRPKPVRLFRVASDGLAHELQGAPVRTGNEYLLLSEDEPAEELPLGVTRAVLRCEGMHGLLLDLPDTFTPELIGTLDRLGVSRAETIDVWPAGLVPARWGADDAATWLATETPCVGLCANHMVERFVLRLADDVLHVEPGGPGEPVFVELPRLDPGRHTLHVSATGAGGEPVVTPAELSIQIRRPRKWRSGNGRQGALLVIVDPTEPTLEQLWEGNLDVEVHGPRDQRVQGTISLYQKGDVTPLAQVALPALKIPVSQEAWHAATRTHVQSNRELQTVYDAAYHAEVNLRVEGIGSHKIIAEREFAPLRWAVSRNKQAFQLRIIDDTGGQDPLMVHHHKFDTPDIGSVLDAARFHIDAGAGAQAGLYVASTGSHRRSVVIPTQVRTLQDLNVEPRIRQGRRTPADIVALLQLIELWGDARLTGSIDSGFKCRKVLEALLRQIFAVIGGGRWGNVEQAFNGLMKDGRTEALREARREISHQRHEEALGVVLERDAEELAKVAVKERVYRLASLGHRYLGLPKPADHPDHIAVGNPGRARTAPENSQTHLRGQSEWLAEFSLRLAGSPVGLLGWAGDQAPDALASLLETPALARAARFMVLSVAGASASQAIAPKILYSNWEWQ